MSLFRTSRRASTFFTDNKPKHTGKPKPERRSTVPSNFFPSNKIHNKHNMDLENILKSNTFEELKLSLENLKQHKKNSLGNLTNNLTNSTTAKQQLLKIISTILDHTKSDTKQNISILEKSKKDLSEICNLGTRASNAKSKLIKLIDTEISTILAEESTILSKNIIKEIQTPTTDEGNIVRGNTDAIRNFSYTLKKQGQGFIDSIAKQTTAHNTKKNGDDVVDRFSSTDQCLVSLNIIITSLEKSDFKRFSELFTSLDFLNKQMETTLIGNVKNKLMSKTQRQKVLKSFIFLRLLNPSIVTNKSTTPNTNSKIMSKLIMQAVNFSGDKTNDQIWSKFEDYPEYSQLTDKNIDMKELRTKLNQMSTTIDNWINTHFFSL